jgi:hypothetical protein
MLAQEDSDRSELSLKSEAEWQEISNTSSSPQIESVLHLRRHYALELHGVSTSELLSPVSTGVDKFQTVHVVHNKQAFTGKRAVVIHSPCSKGSSGTDGSRQC